MSSFPFLIHISSGCDLGLGKPGDECENRDVPCDKCDMTLKFKDLVCHQQYQCATHRQVFAKSWAILQSPVFGIVINWCIKNICSNHVKLGFSKENGLVHCKNDGCRWKGFRRSQADHEAKCLYLKVTCMHCLVAPWQRRFCGGAQAHGIPSDLEVKEVIQKEMPGHQCDRVARCSNFKLFKTLGLEDEGTPKLIDPFVW